MAIELQAGDTAVDRTTLPGNRKQGRRTIPWTFYCQCQVVKSCTFYNHYTLFSPFALSFAHDGNPQVSMSERMQWGWHYNESEH